MRVGTAFWEKYKHYRGKSKYFRGETTKKVREWESFGLKIHIGIRNI